MSTTELIALVGVVVALPAVYWGWHAHRRGVREEKDRKDQRAAEEARRAEAEERKERARRAQEERLRDLNQARFDLMLGPRDGRGSLQLKVVNRGPHMARDVAVKLFVDGRVFQLGQATALVENGQLIARAELGRIAGTYVTGTDSNPVTHPAVSGELVIAYTDGNGPRTLRKHLNVGAGSRFEQRDITITDTKPFR